MVAGDIIYHDSQATASAISAVSPEGFTRG